MVIPLSTLHELLIYHYDRRERLHDFLSRLTLEEYTRRVHTNWGSLHGLLLHCLETEAFWVRHGLQGRDAPEYDPRSYPVLSSVQRLAKEVRRQTEAYVDGLSESDMGRAASVTFAGGGTARFTVSEALFHVIEHDIYHRGQALALAAQMGYEPPDLDLI
jgi:uncharacterized damage-inducible protein DinB